MRDDPGIDRNVISETLAFAFGLKVSEIEFLPLGFDSAASLYHIRTDNGHEYALKVRSGAAKLAGMQAARCLSDSGVPNILAPLPTRHGALSVPLTGDANDFNAVLYPFIHGDSAMNIGLTEVQWRQFGSTLRQVHDRRIESPFAGLRVEQFGLGASQVVRDMSMFAWNHHIRPVAAMFAEFWRTKQAEIDAMLDRDGKLRSRVSQPSYEMVLCHADIHAANILVGEDDQIWLIDWDDPEVAPRERDLLFIMGSNIARQVLPHEEEIFFQGYGDCQIDYDLLVYYRYERIIEDLGEFAREIFTNPDFDEEILQEEAAIAMSFFAPGGAIARVDQVAKA